MTGFIAVHCGAGYHKKSLHKKYKYICKKACLAAGKVLDAGGTALDACQVAVMILEDDPITNAGFGSQLTVTGEVECDASIMDGESLNFGACGAVQGVKYPISLATQICKDQSIERNLGLTPPMLLVGQGAHDYAKRSNLTIIDKEKMIARSALVKHNKNKHLLKTNSSLPQFCERMDTIGAVCVDQRGHVASACSSGGIFLKYSGRVGQAASFACGVWADSFNNRTENSTAVTTTGTGEYLIKTLLAKEIAKNIKNSSCPVTALYKTFKEDFLESDYLKKTPIKLGGALALHLTPSGHGELMWGHTAKSMGLAYLDTSKKKLVGVVSQLPPGKSEGLNIIVSGVSFKIDIS